MFCSYVWSNPNYNELLTGSMCDLSPDMQCLICYFQYATIQFVKFVKGRELEITFYVFSLYLGIEAITLLGSFSYLRRGPWPARQYVQNGLCFICLELPRNEHSTVVVTLASLCALDMKIHRVLRQLSLLC